MRVGRPCEPARRAWLTAQASAHTLRLMLEDSTHTLAHNDFANSWLLFLWLAKEMKSKMNLICYFSLYTIKKKKIIVRNEPKKGCIPVKKNIPFPSFSADPSGTGESAFFDFRSNKVWSTRPNWFPFVLIIYFLFSRQLKEQQGNSK